MKKTVTTILSLALALILVSSLSSGVILAKGDDDHDNRKKNKNKYETVIDVAILDCVSAAVPFAPAMFSAFDGPSDVAGEVPMGVSCAENVAIVLNLGFSIKDVGTIFSSTPAPNFTRYTMLRKRRELIAP